MEAGNPNDGEEQVPEELVGMFNELRLTLQSMHAQAQQRERLQQNLNNNMNKQLRGIKHQLREDGRNVAAARVDTEMGFRTFNPVQQPWFKEYSVDRGAFHEGRVRFYQGIF